MQVGINSKDVLQKASTSRIVAGISALVLAEAWVWFVVGWEVGSGELPNEASYPRLGGIGIPSVDHWLRIFCFASPPLLVVVGVITLLGLVKPRIAWRIVLVWTVLMVLATTLLVRTPGS